jgi:hypothetical protein
MSKKLGKLLDPRMGLMQCKICRQRWFANLMGGGKYRRGSWQCPRGCKIETRVGVAE